MPNWCSGNIRFRGKMDDILRLLRQKLVYCRYTDNHETVSEPAKVYHDESYDEIIVASPFESGNKGWCYISGTHRNFLDLGGTSEFWSSTLYIPENDKKPSIVVFDSFQAAWSIEPEPYVKMSEEFGVDIKIFGWERGVGFDQEIEIVDGNLIRNQATEYKDYGDWMWNTELPYMGG